MEEAVKSEIRPGWHIFSTQRRDCHQAGIVPVPRARASSQLRHNRHPSPIPPDADQLPAIGRRPEEAERLSLNRAWGSVTLGQPERAALSPAA
jgi:hypothetical protein